MTTLRCRATARGNSAKIQTFDDLIVGGLYRGVIHPAVESQIENYGVCTTLCFTAYLPPRGWVTFPLGLFEPLEAE
jgi:hypothetical protein